MTSVMDRLRAAQTLPSLRTIPVSTLAVGSSEWRGRQAIGAAASEAAAQQGASAADFYSSQWRFRNNIPKWPVRTWRRSSVSRLCSPDAISFANHATKPATHYPQYPHRGSQAASSFPERISISGPEQPSTQTHSPPRLCVSPETALGIHSMLRARSQNNTMKLHTMLRSDLAKARPAASQGALHCHNHQDPATPLNPPRVLPHLAQVPPSPDASHVDDPLRCDWSANLHHHPVVSPLRRRGTDLSGIGKWVGAHRLYYV